MTATLFIVATPIGNLQDMSQRAISTLQNVSLVALEDTRQGMKLWSRFGIDTKMQILNKDNEHKVIDKILVVLGGGQDVALISDAGTPLIHDPGSMLVSRVESGGFKVAPVPGACALIAALSVAGFDVSRFVFCGFLPTKKSLLATEIDRLESEVKPMVFYEAPHRIVKTITSLAKAFGEQREAVLARELTKIHEEIVRKSLGEMLVMMASGEIMIKGEMVLIVAGVEVVAVEPDTSFSLNLNDLLAESLKYLSVKDAAKMAASLSDMSHTKVYQACLKLKNKD
ncbi:MAG: 16S rRNA (cytidine(1402)-2'-O)-methyltransferase [Legionellales bacterium]|jgi:16S rRNA (cytidine1402-2'-O)-methyltransferase|nr:16S rRNA (cytidine(1402)-2'-O)-methyltransferase [Legionellales bacterium]